VDLGVRGVLVGRVCMVEEWWARMVPLAAFRDFLEILVLRAFLAFRVFRELLGVRVDRADNILRKMVRDLQLDHNRRIDGLFCWRACQGRSSYG
jgi:hypothetical protein